MAMIEIDTNKGKTMPNLKCTVCDTYSLTTDDLRYHWLSHKTTHPNFCFSCGEGFGTLEEFTDHQIVHKVHYCFDCNEQFITYSDLNEHLEEDHISLFPHFCPICRIGYRSIEEFKEHQAQKHREYYLRNCSLF